MEEFYSIFFSICVYFLSKIISFLSVQIYLAKNFQNEEISKQFCLKFNK